MKLHALLLVTVGLLIGADAPKDDAAKKELKKLEGSYIMISGEEKGDKLPEAPVKNAKLIIEGGNSTDGRLPCSQYAEPKRLSIWRWLAWARLPR
jgi:hypothetical protein